MSIQKKRWREFSPATQIRITLLGVLQIALLGAALWDLSQRTAEEVKGKKMMWAAVSFVNFFGPMAYFLFGRKPRALMSQEEPIGYG